METLKTIFTGLWYLAAAFLIIGLPLFGPFFLFLFVFNWPAVALYWLLGWCAAIPLGIVSYCIGESARNS
jgi:hypothetical protein